jgi:hypothetical protein
VVVRFLFCNRQSKQIARSNTPGVVVDEELLGGAIQGSFVNANLPDLVGSSHFPCASSLM